jgi:hypothetical protein
LALVVTAELDGVPMRLGSIAFPHEEDASQFTHKLEGIWIDQLPKRAVLVLNSSVEEAEKHVGMEEIWDGELRLQVPVEVTK